jgi:hypothetical protein
MGNSINLTETLIIVLGVLAAIFAILVLYAISMVSKLSQMIMEGKSINTTGQNLVQNPTGGNTAAQGPVKSFVDGNDEEERLVAALAASIAASNDKPDSYFHISKITRVR